MDRSWKATSQAPQLAREEVHVWLVDVDARADDDASLDDDERARALRFRDATLRRRFVAAHAALRELLGAYLDVAPRAVDILHAPCIRCGEPHGKPHLAAPGAPSFNLSRRGGWALVAVARDVKVGVDVEDAMRAQATIDGIRSSVLADPEQELLARLPQPAADDELARLWARKEAVLKATGSGFNDDPVDVLVHAPAADDGWRRAGGAAGSGAIVADLDPADGYRGAVALLGAPRAITTWAWRPLAP